MKLPHPERAVVDVAKLRDYCLSPLHEDGKHKARVFAAALGIGQANAEWLRQRLLEGAHGDAVLIGRSQYGSLYMVDFSVRAFRGEAVVRSGWLVRASEDFPRLTTCYVKRTV
jgi:hypothetical protein